MDVPAPIAIVADAILAHCPQYDRASVTVALEAVFKGNPGLLGDNTISMLFGQNNDFTNATVTIGDVHAGHTINVHLPQSLDPTLAALIARASSPAPIHHGDITINESSVSGIAVQTNHGTIHQTIHQPQPIDPLPAARDALAAIPLDHVPEPRADLPYTSRLPFESSPHFVGREDELKQLAAAIGTAQPAVVMPAVATGLGGIGKTSLVTEFAYRYGVYFHGGVFWLNCADPDRITSQIAEFASVLEIDTKDMPLDERVQRVVMAWQSPMPRLLIFDNCEDRAILDQWKPTVGGCRVLVTARSDQWPTFTQIRLGLLSTDESRALLQRLCSWLSDSEADAIAEDLGHLPLALHLAGSYLNTYPHHLVAQYRTDLTIAHQSLKGRGALPSPTRHELDVESTFMLSFNQLDPTNALDALALDILDGAAWCAPGVPLPRELALAFVPDGTESDDAVDALRRLQQLGLLDGTDAVVLHRLLAQVVHARLGSSETLAVVEERMIFAATQSIKGDVSSQMLLFKAHLRYATMRALDRSDARTAYLANALGLFETKGIRFSAAQRLFERALAVLEVVVGSDHLSTVTSMIYLAIVLSAQDKYIEAQRLFERALAVLEVVVGSDHLSTVLIVNQLAKVLLLQARYEWSQRLFERALAVQETLLSPTHPDTEETRRYIKFVKLMQVGVSIPCVEIMEIVVKKD